MQPSKLPLAIRLPIAVLVGMVGVLAVAGVIDQVFVLLWVLGMAVLWIFG